MTVKQITCKGCGKRRKPFLGSRGRPTKYCNECKGASFWKSSFGEWFKGAALRQSPDSMPLNDDDIADIYVVWSNAKRWKGISYTAPRKHENFWEDVEQEVELSDDGSWTVAYEYDLSHLDPVAGDGYQGRLTAQNLIVAPSRVNKSMGNKDVTDFGHRVYTSAKPFATKAEVMQWCGSHYNLSELTQRLGLKPKRETSSDKSWDGGLYSMSPSAAFANEMKRLGGSGTYDLVSKPMEAYRATLEGGIVAGDTYVESTDTGTVYLSCDEF